MFDGIALGELLIDFTVNEMSDQGNVIYESNPGRTPCNVLDMVDMVKISQVELQFITGTDEIEAATGSLMEWYPITLILVKWIMVEAMLFIKV